MRNNENSRIWKSFKKGYIDSLKNDDKNGEKTVLSALALGIGFAFLAASLIMNLVDKKASMILYLICLGWMFMFYLIRWVLQRFGKDSEEENKKKIAAVENAMCSTFGAFNKNSSISTKEAYINCIDLIYQKTAMGKFFKVYKTLFTAGVQAVILCGALLPNFINWGENGKMKAIIWIIMNLFALFIIQDRTIYFVMEDSLIDFVRTKYREYIYVDIKYIDIKK